MLDGDPAPFPKRGRSAPIFGPRLLWPNGCKDQDATLYGGRPQRRQYCVRWGPSFPLPKKGAEPIPNFSANVYCSQMAQWIKMALGREVGLISGHMVLDGDTAPLPKNGGRTPNFWPIFIVAKQLDASRCHLLWSLSPGDFVLDGDPAPSLKRGGAPNFLPTSTVAKWLDGSRYPTWYGSRPRRRPHTIRRGPSSGSAKGIQQPPPLFGPCLLWPRSPISATAELL